MARRPVEVPSIGSDSFLDVVANIVGILIILIVVAGVRVGRAPLLSISDVPVEEQKSPDTTVSLWANVPIEDDAPVDPDLFVEPVPAPLRPKQHSVSFTPPPQEQFPPLEEVKVSDSLVQNYEALQHKIRLLDDELSRAEEQYADLSESLDLLHLQHSAIGQQLLNSDQKRVQLRHQLAMIEQENDQSERVIEQLQERLGDVSKKEPKTKTLKHRLNPLGRMVSGREVHFCVANGRVSYVPIDELTALVKDQMQRRKEMLLKQPRYQATVGPVDGYTMTFLVQRQSNGLLGESRYGANMVKISVTDWVIEPTKDVLSESLEEALGSGSQFRKALVSQGTNATITFWVYPDGFQVHQELKAFLHDYGFWVASRPLPSGFAIEGSASGSKSFAQ